MFKISKSKTSKISSVALIFLALPACSSKHQTAAAQNNESPSATQIAHEENVDLVGQIGFDKNSSTLSSENATAISNVIQSARNHGKIDEVKIIAWGDKSYPNVKKHLSDKQVTLAKHRGQSIEDDLKENLNVGSVEIYNMAERPNALDRLFNTSDVKIKKSMEVYGLTSNKFPYPNQQSKAYVLVLLKKDDQ